MTIFQYAVWATCLTTAAVVWAEDQLISANEQWAGSVEDSGLLGKPPLAITTAKGWEAQWKAWKLEGEAPKVDFAKHFVVVQTTTGGKLNLRLKLTAEGDLKVAGLATRDLRPGFRYVLGTVPREGVKTVNGTPLPE